MIIRWLGVGLIGAALMAGGCTNGVRGSGVAATQTREVPAYERVELSGAAKAEFEIGALTPLTVTADDNIIDLVETVVRDGCLYIALDGRANAQTPIVVKGRVPQLNGLSASGATNLIVSGVQADALKVDVSGASRLQVSGQAARVKLDASGASSAELVELAADEVEFDVSGASGARVKVGRKLHGDASGASKVTYSGAATDVQTDVSGAAQVVRE